MTQEECQRMSIFRLQRLKPVVAARNIVLEQEREVRGAMGGVANVRACRWVPSPNRWGICQLRRVVG